MNKKYLTIHGHFYQPPRENPWIEEVEVQQSAFPSHDWNEKVSWQCYSPNGASRIVDSSNKILEISNNYEYISFNFGPTLLSWLEKYDNPAYQKILEADRNSTKMYGGHGNALAQVYNHIIMPLANRNDKITQVLWGLKDFQKRFKRNAEGIWLAETAVDAQTLEVLIECGIKFTILSPYQAKCVNKIGEKDWKDVSWGSIDPSQPYRYFVEGSNKQKYIDLFFYDGSISKSVAFDNLLTNGENFANRLNDGFVEDRNRAQLINIATDGESYGHHTKFGDMALAYVVKLGAKKRGFEITNYAQFLEMYPPKYEVDIKPVSAWSCSHGVGRWCDDCGCSTGAQPHWNQKWRKPLRQALDYLRDELIKICSTVGVKYYKDFWTARNNYIDVILDRSLENINLFLKQNGKKNLKTADKVNAIKLMEVQRMAQLMYTSCGWFFADISGIETTQILKYALRAIELIKPFTKIDIEKPFLSILQKAKSNILEYGNGKDIYNKFVKTAIITSDQIAAQYAIEAYFEKEEAKKEELYCFRIKKHTEKRYQNLNQTIVFGKMEIISNITCEKEEKSYVMFHEKNSDFYCAVKDYVSADDFELEKGEILSIFEKGNLIDILKSIETYYESKFYSLKDIPMDRRKVILENLIIKNLKKASRTYKDLYESLLSPICYLNDLGMDIPEGFRVCAKYTLLSTMYKELSEITDYSDKKKIDKLLKIKKLTDKFYIKLNDFKIKEIMSQRLLEQVILLKNEPNLKNNKELLDLFDLIEKLEIEVHISNAQNIFYEMFCSDFEEFNKQISSKSKDNVRKLYLGLLETGEKLRINMDFYKEKINSLTGKV